MFSSGYNNGQDGPLGRFPVAVARLIMVNMIMVWWGFTFSDPSGNNLPLQAYTGSLGRKFGNSVYDLVFWQL